MAEKPHDRLFKLLLSDPQNLKDFIRLFLPKSLVKHLDLNSLKPIPPEKMVLSKRKRKILDFVVEVKLKSQKNPIHIYLLFEHKSKPDKYTFVQIIHYIAALWEENVRKGEKLIPVVAIIFYHGRGKWDFPFRFGEYFDVPEEIKKYLIDFEYILFNTEEVGDEELLRKIELANILVLGIYLLKNAWRGKEFIKEGLKAFAEAVKEFEERHEVYFQEFLMYIIEVGRVKEEEVEEMIREGDWSERTKQVFQRLVNKWKEEGFQQGIQQGFQQGIEQGIILDAQKGEVTIGQQKKSVKNFVITENTKEGKIQLQSQLYHMDGEYCVVYMKSYGQFIVMDSETFHSTYVQMFILGKYNTDLFELVVSSPYSKIYKLKR